MIFGAILLVLTGVTYFVPYYDWDLAAYTGAAIAVEQRNATAIHQQAYAALRQEIPEDDYQDIAAGSAFRRDVAGNPDHFIQQLRFYQIRPLYVRLLFWWHKVGIGYVEATRLISVISFFLLGSCLFLWATRYIVEWHAAVGILLLMITPAIFTAARTGSPDALSALLVVVGVYCLFERERLVLGCICLLFSLLLRTDNVIFVSLLLIWLSITQNLRRRKIVLGTCAILSVGLVLGINRLEQSYGWPVLMQNTSAPIVNPAEIAPSFTIADYLSTAHDTVDQARESSIVVFPFIAALGLLSPRLTRPWKRLVVVVLLSWAARIILFPHIEDRYFVSGAAIIGFAALLALLDKNGVHSSKKTLTAA
jgi:hypothetical protein